MLGNGERMKKGKGMRNAKRILSGLMVAAMLLGGGQLQLQQQSLMLRRL